MSQDSCSKYVFCCRLLTAAFTKKSLMEYAKTRRTSLVDYVVFRGFAMRNLLTSQTLVTWKYRQSKSVIFGSSRKSSTRLALPLLCHKIGPTKVTLICCKYVRRHILRKYKHYNNSSSLMITNLKGVFRWFLAEWWNSEKMASFSDGPMKSFHYWSVTIQRFIFLWSRYLWKGSVVRSSFSPLVSFWQHWL